MKSINYSTEELKWIKANRKLTRKDLTNKFNQKFNRNLEVTHIKSLCTRKGWKTGRKGFFKNGMTPWNKGKKGLINKGCEKGWFKKGHVPHNNQPIGALKWDTKDKYQWEKIAEPDKWRQSHYLLWEKEKGKVKKGNILRFKDGNKKNITIENLEEISRSEHIRLNQMNYKNAPEQLKPTIKLMAQLQAKAGEVKQND